MEARIDRNLLYLAISLVVFGVVLRLLPHPPNLAPVGAIALFSGAMLPRKLAWWLPLAIMATSDYVLGFYDGIGVTWLAFLLVTAFGLVFRSSSTGMQIVWGALGGGAIFFAVSNFGVWLFGGLYAHTWSGLANCFVMAVPFFRNTLLGNLLYGAILFGGFALAKRRLNAAPLPKAST